jgi:hypothetical protein
MPTNIGQSPPARRGPNLDLKRVVLDRILHAECLDLYVKWLSENPCYESSTLQPQYSAC